MPRDRRPRRRRTRRPPAWKPPRLTIPLILRWADAYFARNGRWPAEASGRVPESPNPGENWSRIQQCLQKGLRGLNRGNSLSKVLRDHRGVRRIIYRPRLTIKQVLRWADAHRRRTGRWPTVAAGPIPGSDNDTWGAIHDMLMKGGRGLPGGTSLAQFLTKHRGYRNPARLPPYKPRKILAWADAYFLRNGYYPRAKSEGIPEAPGETWRRVDGAFRKGHRGLPGGSSLAQFLWEHSRALSWSPISALRRR